MEINPQAAIVIGVILYKLTCLIVGLAICFMGYRLFLADVKTGLSDASVSWKGAAFSLQRAAPGTFFALFGAVVISVTVWKGFTADATSEQGTPITQAPQKGNNAQPTPSDGVATTK
jgi:hypothetical protein